MSEKPPEKPTKEIEQPPPWATAIMERMTHGFNGLRTDIQLVANDVTLVKERVTLVEKRVGDHEERLQKHSGGTRQLSESDAAQDRAIAETLTKVRGLEGTVTALSEKADALAIKTDAQTEVLGKLARFGTGLINDPRVKALTWALWLALAGWLASKGIHVEVSR